MLRMIMRLTFSLIVLLMFPVFLAGCESIESEAKYPTGYDRNMTGGDVYGEKESIVGDRGLKILGGRSKDDGNGSGIGVNGFLWRASLDTVSFMPLASADPFGGVILTDWYSPDDSLDERYKINVFILGRELRSDGVQVKVFKQIKRGGAWADKPSDDSTARTLEDAILTRARQLRVAQLDR